jgi:GT2 family glycosyltransferase
LPSKISCLVGLDSRQSGIILASGQNIMPKILQGIDCSLVEWMSGCAMSYRFEIIKYLEFDERRYFIGEDTEFSHRVSKRGRLIFNSRAIYRHASSKLDAPNSNHQIADHVHHLALFSIDYQERIRPLAVKIMLMSKGFYYCFQGIKKLEVGLFNYGIKYIWSPIIYSKLIRNLLKNPEENARRQ